MDLETQITELQSELKGYFKKAEDAGTISADLKSQIEETTSKMDALESKLVNRMVFGNGLSSTNDVLHKTLSEDKDLQALLKGQRGVAMVHFPVDPLERKTTLTSTSVGFTTPGVLQSDRGGPIVSEARQALSLRSILASRPTTLPLVDYVKVSSPMTVASPQIETHTKHENSLGLTCSSERVRTLASFCSASRQILADLNELESFLRTSLSYYVDLAEENQLISGSGSGEDLNGLLTQATALNTSLLPLSGWNRNDVAGAAIEQISIAKEVPATFIVLHPHDYWLTLREKDNEGRYLHAGMTPFWGLKPVVTTSMTSGTFLVGSGSPVASEIRDRQGLSVEIATQHGTQFTENVVTIRAEKRCALIVYRPGSYIRGNFSQSPQ
jgi:HK97 family phage major capsid protein